MTEIVLRRWSCQIHIRKVRDKIRSKIKGAMDHGCVLVCFEDLHGVSKDDFLEIVSGWPQDRVKLSALQFHSWYPTALDIPAPPANTLCIRRPVSLKQTLELLVTCHDSLGIMIKVFYSARSDLLTDYDIYDNIFGELDVNTPSGLVPILKGVMANIGDCLAELRIGKGISDSHALVLVSSALRAKNSIELIHGQNHPMVRRHVPVESFTRLIRWLTAINLELNIEHSKQSKRPSDYQ
ncbi:MAG: hypothetical protein HC904_09075 [Blastochloris sp.]|nr:hypothetical protein [Blastochloris sp.]